MSTPISKMTKQQLIDEIETTTGISVSGDETVAHLRAQLTAIRQIAEDYDAREPTPLDISTLRNRRRARLEGKPFVLRATTDDEGNPTVVRVRIPDLMDADTMESLPGPLRAEVFGIIQKVEDAQQEAMRNAKPGGDGSEILEDMSTSDLVEQYGSISKFADAYVIAGFIEPRVYATPEEADEQGGAWVKDIEFADRMAFFNHCTQNERGAANLAKPFPAGPV